MLQWTNLMGCYVIPRLHQRNFGLAERRELS